MDVLAGDVELTEFEALDVRQVKGVGKGANGFPMLMMKGLAKADGDGPTHGAFSGTHSHSHAANGAQGDDGSHEHEHSHDGDGGHGHGHATKADGECGTCEGSGKIMGGNRDCPDCDGPAEKSALAIAVKAVTDGKIDEAPDISLGQQIMSLLGQAIANEAQEIEAGEYDETFDVGLLNRAADMISCWVSRESSPDDGGMGIVMDSVAVRKLIAEELAKANPLDGKGDTSKGAVAEGEADVQTDAQGTGGLSKAVEDAVTKAMEPVTKELGELRAFKAKVEATPVPGGPVMSLTRAQPRGEDTEDHAAKAAYFEQMAATVASPADADNYRQLAAKARARAIAPA